MYSDKNCNPCKYMRTSESNGANKGHHTKTSEATLKDVKSTTTPL